MNSGLIHVLVHEWMLTSVVCFVSFLWPFPPPLPPQLWVGIHSTYLFVSVVLTGTCGLAAIYSDFLASQETFILLCYHLYYTFPPILVFTITTLSYSISFPYSG